MFPLIVVIIKCNFQRDYKSTCCSIKTCRYSTLKVNKVLYNINLQHGQTQLKQRHLVDIPTMKNTNTNNTQNWSDKPSSWIVRIYVAWARSWKCIDLLSKFWHFHLKLWDFNKHYVFQCIYIYIYNLTSINARMQIHMHKQLWLEWSMPRNTQTTWIWPNEFHSATTKHCGRSVLAIEQKNSSFGLNQILKKTIGGRSVLDVDQ